MGEFVDIVFCSPIHLRQGLVRVSPYQKPYTKALGKDRVLVTHEQTAMQKHASQKADLFHDKVDYSVSDANRGNFIALLQLMAKGNNVL